jgi:hypothetical protein
VPAFALLLADPGRRRRLLAAIPLAVLFYSRLPWWSGGHTNRSAGVPEALWRTANLSFTIATVLLIVVLPLKSLTQVPTSWARGDMGRTR